MREEIASQLVRAFESPDVAPAKQQPASLDEVRALGQALLDLAAVGPAEVVAPTRHRRFHLPFLSK